MRDVTASYGRSFDFIAFLLGIFIHNWRAFMSEVFYLQQTFTDCMSNYCTYFGMYDKYDNRLLPYVVVCYGSVKMISKPM